MGVRDRVSQPDPDRAPLTKPPLPGRGIDSGGHGRQDSAITPPATVQKYQQEVDAELLVEKEQTIHELREMVTIMSEKIKKLEQLVRLKDSKIEALNDKLRNYGLS